MVHSGLMTYCVVYAAKLPCWAGNAISALQSVTDNYDCFLAQHAKQL